jgi:hypothetical protein
MVDIYERTMDFIDKSKEYREVRSEYRDLVVNIIHSITSRKKIYCDKKFTFRDSNLFIYNKSSVSSLQNFLYDEESFSHLKQYVRDDSLSEKLTNLRSRITNNTCSNLGIYTDYLNSNRDRHTGVFYLKKNSNNNLISIRSMVDKSCEYRLISNYEDYYQVFSELQNEYYMSLDYDKNNWRSLHSTTKRFSISRSVNGFGDLVEEAISNIESDIEFYKKEIDRIKKDFSKELVILEFAS